MSESRVSLVEMPGGLVRGYYVCPHCGADLGVPAQRAETVFKAIIDRVLAHSCAPAPEAC
jgi:hypothetical protein